MGTIAARKARTILEHVETVIGIELMCATQALDLRRPLKANAGIEAAHTRVRRDIAPLDDDRFLQADIETAVQLVSSGDILNAVEDVVGRLDGSRP